MQRRVIIAAGHGGGDSGATGQGTTEANEVVDIVNRTAQKLQADGQLEVVVVPHELNLIDEINWVNARYAFDSGLAAEIHKNATENAHGIECWYFSGDQASADLASTALAGIMSVPGMPQSRGIKGDATNRYGRLGWIRDTNPAALLFEMGFVSNGGDPVGGAANDMYAEGLKMAFLKVFGLSPAAPVPVSLPPVTPEIRFRVFAGDKQIGAYNQEPNAWNKYAAEGGTKIVDSNGADITASLVAKYRVTPPEPPVVVTEPPVPAPVIVPVEDPHPVTDPDISSFKLQVREIAAKLELLWKFILSWFNKGK